METYDEWGVIHSDSMGLEAREKPDSKIYGINKVCKYRERILPILLLSQKDLSNIATKSFEYGNSLIEMIACGMSIKNTEFQEFIENGDNIYLLNAFIKSTYIKLVKQGKIMIN